MSNAPIILDIQCIACDKTLQKIHHHPERLRSLKMRNASSGRRMRTPNWSSTEKKYLLELIKERKLVVATISTTGAHSEERTAAWNDIMKRLIEKFGSKFAGSTIKKVKTQWQNMKRIAREELSARIVSQQSMEVCNILDVEEESRTVKEEMDNGGSTSTDFKSEQSDKKLIEIAMTMDVSAEMTPALPSANATAEHAEDFTEELSSSPAVSEYIRVSDTEEPARPNVTNKSTAASFNVDVTTTPRPPSPILSNPHRANGNSWRDGGNAWRDGGDANEIFGATKKLKQEMMKEERQVLRALRETAELNKITAEHRLKHMLWLTKHEQGMYSGEPGSGAGRGGGGGGAIREAGGAFGKMEAAREDEYFYKKQKEQLKALKAHLNEEISFHEQEIRRHQEAIKRHQDNSANLDKN